jgi:hypothetical protein
MNVIEGPKGSILGQAFRRILFPKNPDLYTEYKIPEKVHDVLNYDNHLPILINGPRDNLQVRGIYNDRFINFNELAPPKTRFSISEFENMVRTEVDSQAIIIPARKKYRDALVFGLFHAIGRLQIHEDPDWHKRSMKAHQLLRNATLTLRSDGKVKFPRSLIDRAQELEAWKVVCQEEKTVSTNALQLIAGLIEGGFNPIPQIQNKRQLEQLVNSHHLLRTLRQIKIDPQLTEKQIGKRMTLLIQEISEILHV